MSGTPRQRAGAGIFAPARAVLLIGIAAFACTAAALENGKPAPAFTLAALGDGKRISLDQYRGKVVFVDFWASWCGPCRQSLPLYDKLDAELAQRGFAVLAINLDEDDADANAFLKDHPVHYTVLRDPAGETPKAFGLVGMPTSYLIDKAGVIRAQHSGFNPADIDTLRKQIDALLETHGDADAR